MLIRFTPEADLELTEAREWYSHQRDGLDAELMDCIDERCCESFAIRSRSPSSIAISGASLFVAFRLPFSTVSRASRYS